MGDIGSLHDAQTAAALDNKQNMEQREQYYATVRKPLRSPIHEMATLEKIPGEIERRAGEIDNRALSIRQTTDIDKKSENKALRRNRIRVRGKRLRPETTINESPLNMLVEYSEDIYPYATFQLEESVPAGGDSRCNSAAPLQTFVYHDPRLSTADTLQLREVSFADLLSLESRSRRTFFFFLSLHILRFGCCFILFKNLIFEIDQKNQSQ